MNRTIVLLAGLAAGIAVNAPAPAAAQSVGYVTGIPGPDPARGGDGIGWGPAYQPETSYAQPGTPPTPGQIAGAAYRARTGRGVYDDVEGPFVTGGLGYGYAPPPFYAPRVVYAPRRVVRPYRVYSGHRRVIVRRQARF